MTFSVEYGGPLTADHVLRHDPARVLAEIEAKRRHIELWREGSERMRAAIAKQNAATSDLAKKSASLQRAEAVGFHDAMGRVLEADVMVYVGHPDFDEAWRC